MDTNKQKLRIKDSPWNPPESYLRPEKTKTRVPKKRTQGLNGPLNRDNLVSPHKKKPWFKRLAAFLHSLVDYLVPITKPHTCPV